MLLVFFNWMAYMQISGMLLGVNIISRKNSVASINRAGGVWGCSETTVGVSGARTLKENLDWLKIDLNVVEIITV